MLTVKYVDNEKQLSSLYDKLGIQNKDYSGIIAVLFEDDNMLGFCRLRLMDSCVEIKDYKLLKEAEEERGVSDFFFRTILFKLSKTSMLIIIDTDDNRLLKFGFTYENGKMIAYPDDIEFPSTCGGHH